MIRNPVLPGAHPDPSLVRVGDTYYLATSTFEWLPGVTLHQSQDLVTWKPIGGALTEARLIELEGTVDSGGIWAPCLSWADGLFHLVYTHVVGNTGPFLDLRNYVVTAPSVTGPWSDPVRLHGRGFDPSLFHDTDGRSWLLSMQSDHRPGHERFSGIALQEWSREHRALTGPVHRILGTTAQGCTEGAHLYRRDGWYYLLVAEGGTGFEHGALMLRSRDITGPYEPDPSGPLMTTRDLPDHPLQKTGHACLVDTGHGEWYAAHLCSRPAPGTRQCVMGRETGIQRVDWPREGWPRLATPDGRPAVDVEPPAHLEVRASGPTDPYTFRAAFHGSLEPEFQTLRVHADPSWADLESRPGALRLTGQESLSSVHRQSLVGVRRTSLVCRAETTVDFDPVNHQQSAGLALFYNTKHWHYAQITHDEARGRVLRVSSLDFEAYSESVVIDLPADGPIGLACDVADTEVRFRWSHGGGAWVPAGPELDGTLLSEDHATRRVRGQVVNWGFTGTMLALAAQDLTGERRRADFTEFWYGEG